jgi:hypothetical protein
VVSFEIVDECGQLSSIDARHDFMALALVERAYEKVKAGDFRVFHESKAPCREQESQRDTHLRHVKSHAT